MTKYLYMGTASIINDTLDAKHLDDVYYDATLYPHKKIQRTERIVFFSYKKKIRLRHIMPIGTRGLLWHKDLIAVIEDLTDDVAELIPASINDKTGNCLSDEYYLVNVLFTPEVIDFKKSDVEAYKGGTWKTYFINKFVADYSKTMNTPIFQNPSWYLPDIVFVRQDIAEKIMALGLDVRIYDPTNNLAWRDKPLYPLKKK